MSKLSSNDSLTRYLQSIEYKPASLLYPNRKTELKYYPLTVRYFLSLLTDKDRGVLSAADLYGRRICNDKELLEDYYSLMKEHERVNFLMFHTIDVHELTHHIDFMTTPFGVNYYVKLCSEYIAFQQFVPELLRHPELIGDEETLKLIGFDDIISSSKSADFELSKRWSILKEKIRFYDAYFYQGEEKMRPVQPFVGYPTFELFGERFDRVLVNDFMITIKIPNKTDYYLRPVTILEARGLIHSLRWILYQLGYNRPSVLEAINYLKIYYYSSEDILQDYRFLLDLFLRMGDLESYSDFENCDARGIDTFLSVISSICWYALQAPPPVAETSLLAASPVVRLLLAARIFENNNFTETCSKILKGEKIDFHFSMETLFHKIDSSYQNLVLNDYGNIGLLPIAKILDVSIRTVNQMKDMNMAYVIDSEIRKHFDYIFNIQKYQLGKRLHDGYLSNIGIPPFGNPMYAIKDTIDADQLIPINYIPPEHVRTWFGFREDFIFKSLWKGKLIKMDLQKIFGSLEEVSVSEEMKSLKFNEDILMTMPVNYNIEAAGNGNNDNSFIEIIVDDHYLPKIKDLQNAIIEHQITDYAFGSHAFLHIEIRLERTSEFKKLNVFICPFKMNNDPLYKRKIEFLIQQTADPITKQYPIKEAEIHLLNTTFNNIFWDEKLTQEEKKEEFAKSHIFYCKMTSRLEALSRWYHNLLQSGIPPLDLDLFYRTNACPFCKRL